MAYAQVIVDINHAQLDRFFEYEIPEALDIKIGSRVLVSFGHSRQPIEGFVIAIQEESNFDPAKIKPIQRMLDPYTVLLPDQIVLAKWMAEEYNASLVSTLRLMIPSQLRGGRVKEKKALLVTRVVYNEELDKAFQSLQTSNHTCKAPKQRDLLQLLEEQPSLLMREIEQRIPNARTALRSMEKKGWIKIEEEAVFRQPYHIDDFLQEKRPQLTKDQEKVIASITSLESDEKRVFVLRGVTGSGKTEVYLRCIEACIQQGKQSIVLVPEISLTPQTVERFCQRFGEKIAVLHSRLSAGERYDEWRRIRLGEVSVVVGARSAVFAPLENIGLIVIDEEHETSYQSDSTPRYHAIDVAKKRCEQHNGVLLLGSATPSIETWYRAQQGEFQILNLPHRINNQPLPAVEVIDMREELAKGNRNIFSTALYQRMRACYFAGHQMILFLNRRGYSTFVSCRGCGEVLKCSQCDVSMTYHKIDATVRCHYCDTVRAIPAVCPTCGKPYLKHFGLGTQQVEEQVQRLFPGIRTVRMDHDTTQRKNSHAELLQIFRNREAEVLIGTQMITKGLDFPNVTLVGVLAADATLFIPNYRSAERAFQLITQVAGRAGRDKEEGHVIVQTYSPEHASIRYSAKHDFEAFYEYEIACREQGGFPPFTDFIRFLFQGEDEQEVEQRCKQFKERLLDDIENFIMEQHLNAKTLLYVSAHKAPLYRLRRKFRYQVIVKLIRNEEAKTIIKRIALFARDQQEQGERTTMEINPQSMI